MEPTQDPRSIFGRALGLESPAGRAEYLDEACGGDAGLRAEVEGLLAANDRAGEFMRRPAVAGMTTEYEPLAEGPGTRIGPYRLLQQIGEGGMGVVYMAEQEEPVRRKVALKIIKPGMDSRQVVARFEAERQALAMMDHANIARVFDAGTTESGRPYFVMELVHGVPITEYCDANMLTPRERLELFVPVCHAIQHAHQKGVIHRDIKPSNILVTMYDDKPVPKVIDFGVAKAVEQRLTEKTLFTKFGVLVGTFEYMSPEQAEMNAFGVDTRSDIYALGVLLYELMTGTTPLERLRLREAAFSEIVRLIKEEEPPRPSVRLSTSGTLEKVAAVRKTEPAKLPRLMRGELDWVVMRCLEKDRSRRYEAASALARDVERFLKDEPVEARPPTAWYRLRKSIHRNRTALVVAGVVAGVVVLGAAASLWQASIARANHERARLAEEERIADRVRAEQEIRKRDAALVAERRQNALDRAIESAFGGDLAKADKAIIAAEAGGVAADRVHWLRGLVHYQQGKFEDAVKEFDASIALKPSVAAQAMLAHALFYGALPSGKPLNRWARSVISDLDAMTPETTEDYLCRGFISGMSRRARGLAAPRKPALDDIDRAIALRDTPIARAFRAIAECEYAFNADEPDVAAIEDALRDLQKAKLTLPDNKFIRFKSLVHQLDAANEYEAAGLPDGRKAVLEEAGRDAQELKGIPTLVYILVRAAYFERVGDTNAVLAELDEASRRPETSDLARQYALILYDQGRDDEARRVLDERLKPDNVAGKLLRIVLSAEQPEIGRDKAYESYRELQNSLRREERASPFDFLTLLVLGKKKEAVDEAALSLNLTGSSYMTYLTGAQSEAEFLQSAGKRKLLRVQNHFLVALVRLSGGDREGAREHFRKVLETKFYGHNSYPFAHAYLARLERDPAWPRWIPVKK